MLVELRIRATARRAIAGLAVLPLALAPVAAAAAELEPRTVAAYEQYIAILDKAFAPQLAGSLSIELAHPDTVAHLRRGEILAWPGGGDGIIDVPGGLIHHWRGAAFIPGATLEAVLAIVRDYPAYHERYDWVVGSTAIAQAGDAGRAGERFWVLLRLERSANVVTSVVDLWTRVDYRYPRRDRAAAVSHADCVKQVEDAGRANERRLPAGTGSGYLWRANTYTTYLEKDGGVYVDLQTIGLSRGFPPLLGWLIEPIARRLGRGSATDTLAQLRDAATAARPPARSPAAVPAAPPPGSWCDPEPAPAAA